VEVFLADHKDVNNSEWIVVGSTLVIPLIGLLYVRLTATIMRRAGVPPIAEHVGSLRTPERAVVAEPVALRKAA
jgi:hypothetical protein